MCCLGNTIAAQPVMMTPVQMMHFQDVVVLDTMYSHKILEVLARLLPRTGQCQRMCQETEVALLLLAMTPAHHLIDASQASRGESYHCPECDAPVILKHGTRVSAYFAHLVRPPTCSLATEIEEHLWMCCRCCSDRSNFGEPLD
jgi:hypothetical protein